MKTFDKDKLNQMCLDCTELGKSCAGETCQHYTACIWKRPKWGERKEDSGSYIPIIPREQLERNGVVISELAKDMEK